MTLEPTAPEKGPDLRADWKGVPYFIEIRTVGYSEDEDRRDSVTNEIFAKLNVTPSSYSVMLTVSEEYRAGSPELKDAIDSILWSLEELKARGVKKATLFFAGKGELVLLSPGYGIAAENGKILEKANFVAEFEHLGKEQAGTPASLFEQKKKPPPEEQNKKLPPKPVNDHKRLRRILDDKRKQLPNGSRGIILLDVSELFMLSDFSIERALYGDLVVEFDRVSGPEERVGEPKWRRNTTGFLLHTSRVSAVVIQKRKVENGEAKIERRVYPTNRANDDTIRLSLAELKRFGDLGDREHLSAENAPDKNEEKD